MRACGERHSDGPDGRDSDPGDVEVGLDVAREQIDRSADGDEESARPAGRDREHACRRGQGGRPDGAPSCRCGDAAHRAARGPSAQCRPRHGAGKHARRRWLHLARSRCGRTVGPWRAVARAGCLRLWLDAQGHRALSLPRGARLPPSLDSRAEQSRAERCGAERSRAERTTGWSQVPPPRHGTEEGAPAVRPDLDGRVDRRRGVDDGASAASA